MKRSPLNLLALAAALIIPLICGGSPLFANAQGIPVATSDGDATLSEIIPGLTPETENLPPSLPLPRTRKGELPPAEVIPGITRAQESSLLPILTKAEHVKRLTADEAAQGYVVRLAGVITMNIPGLEQIGFQDETGSLLIGLSGQGQPPGRLNRGERIEVLGKTIRGRFSRHVSIDRSAIGGVEILGNEGLPEPAQLSAEEFSDPKSDGQWSEIKGVIRRVKPVTYRGLPWAIITLSSGNTRFEAMCFIGDEDSNMEGLVGSEVGMRGVACPMASERGQLAGRYFVVASPSEIAVLRPPERNPFVERVRPIDSLPRLEIGQNSSPRVHVLGAVTFKIPGLGFYINDGTASVRVEHPDMIPEVGETVSVLGFAEWGAWSPVLQDAAVNVIGRQIKPVPRAISSQQISDPNFDGTLIQTDATLLHFARSASGPLMVLQNEGRVFESRFVGEHLPDALTSIPEQSRVRLTGLLVYQRPPDWVDELGLRSTGNTAFPIPFEVWLASPKSVQILSKPSWWTTTRIAIALSTLGVATLAVLAWIHTLRSQVELLTEINSAQKVREATSDERTRVARELHDSVEQELAGLTIQLDALKALLSQSPDAVKSSLETARAMLRHTREEARRSIWDLRSMVLERGDLGAALNEVATNSGTDSNIHVKIEVIGTPVKLSPKAELNLMRICQEATSNARKYSSASRLTVKLEYASDRVSMTVSDNGTGFEMNDSNSIRTGHFGLVHMRERAEQIGAELHVSSSSGKGTTITAELPLPKTSP